MVALNYLATMKINISNPFEAITIELHQIKKEQERLVDIIDNKEQSSSDIITLPQASELIGKAKQTIYELCSKKLVPHFKRRGSLYFSRKQLIEWLTTEKYAQNLVEHKV